MTENPSRKSAGPGLILAFIALLSAVPRLLLGASQYVEYDGYWHLFIAQQDKWANFWADIYSVPHPPLFFLLLRAVLHFGRSLLVYRSISLVTGIVTIYLLGIIAKKITGSNILSYESALAYGFALPSIIVSCEVRSYMLSVFFVLLSFLCLLKLIEPRSGRSETRARTGFALWAILAGLSHFFAFFYSGAAVLLLAGRFVFDLRTGKIANWKSRAVREAATTLPILAFILAQYEFHAKRFVTIQPHLIPYYFDRHGQETVQHFLLRNWKNFVNLFSPFPVSSDLAALGILAAIMAAGIASGVLLQRAARRGSDAHQRAIRAFWTLIVAAVILAGFAIGGVTGKYPFGGDLRQQYLAFPFLILAAAVFADRIAALVPGFPPALSRIAANALAIVAAVAIVAISVVRYHEFPKIQTNILADQWAIFNRMEPAPQAVYVDQFSLITFFTYHHNWDWSFVKLDQPTPQVDAYRVRRGNQQMLVFRDKTDWNVDPDRQSLYKSVAECLRAGKTRDLSVFAVRQSPPLAPLAPTGVKRAIASGADASAVCVQRLSVNPAGWYATFRQSGCDAPPPLRLTGAFDDTSDAVQFTGQWVHFPSFPQASGGTLSFSNDPTAVAQLSFRGAEITYVYTKAFNRGMAEVRVDGSSHGVIDLYSPRIQWQSSVTFRGLKPGLHTFELRATGRKQAAATDRYIDLDALIVR